MGKLSVDHQAQALHDKATRGAALSASEQARLSQWYEREDAAEQQLLSRSSGTPASGVLQHQIDRATAQLLDVAQRIQDLRAESETVRQEIVGLQRELASRRGAQPV